jgi:putative solute:sodium symporter small subunit
MIEIGLGLLLVAAAFIVLTGAGDALGLPHIDFLPLLGYGGVAFLLALGLLMLAAGFSRRAIKRNHGARHALRSARLAMVALLLVACLALGSLLGAEPFNLVRIDGMPLGYDMAAQAGLIGLVILAFVWAGRQNRIDAEESEHE